jgi:hypothetical protein
MVQFDEHAKPSEARVERALKEAVQHLGRMETSPTTQRLKLSLEAFRRILTSWRAHPPTRAQLTLVEEHVAEILQRARESAPTEKIRRSA